VERPLRRSQRQRTENEGREKALKKCPNRLSHWWCWTKVVSHWWNNAVKKKNIFFSFTRGNTGALVVALRLARRWGS
jgi:hypothetical protein